MTLPCGSCELVRFLASLPKLPAHLAPGSTIMNAQAFTAAQWASVFTDSNAQLHMLGPAFNGAIPN